MGCNNGKISYFIISYNSHQQNVKQFKSDIRKHQNFPEKEYLVQFHLSQLLYRFALQVYWNRENITKDTNTFYLFTCSELKNSFLLQGFI